jgi:hypothetical protein
MNDMPHWVVKSQRTTCPSRAAANIFPSQHKLWSAESPEDKKEYLEVRMGYKIIKPKQIFNKYTNVLFNIFVNDVDLIIIYMFYLTDIYININEFFNESNYILLSHR